MNFHMYMLLFQNASGDAQAHILIDRFTLVNNIKKGREKNYLCWVDCRWVGGREGEERKWMICVSGSESGGKIGREQHHRNGIG